MSFADTYIRSEAVVSRLIGGETLVVPVRGGVGDLASIYSFNEVGTIIWGALASPTSLAELVDLIEREYPGNRGQVVQDVVLFLSDIRSAGLVTIANAPEDPAFRAVSNHRTQNDQQLHGKSRTQMQESIANPA
jgi:coenzyme PQQ synthesis protein D (PqqD)